jgi:hypothetical protein
MHREFGIGGFGSDGSDGVGRGRTGSDGVGRGRIGHSTFSIQHSAFIIQRFFIECKETKEGREDVEVRRIASKSHNSHI